MNLPNHTVVFGASGGIGRELVYQLLSHGRGVTAVGRDADRLRDLHEKGARIEVANAAKMNGLASLSDKLDGVDAVVNCIGNLHLRPLHRSAPSDFVDTMQINVLSMYQILHTLIPVLPQGGSVVGMSTVATARGLKNHELIAAAKAAVEAMMQSAAVGYAKKGIRFNCVAPGLTETPMTASLASGPARKASEEMHPLGRIGQPTDIVSAILWLLSPDQSWVTGQTLRVDGGLSAA